MMRRFIGAVILSAWSAFNVGAVVSIQADSSTWNFLGARKFTAIKSNHPEFETLFRLIGITLDHNKVAFMGKTGLVRGFAAGAGYPQIWIRDAATIIPASRYFYPAPYLRSWLRELLALQGPDGNLPDWFNSRGVKDKNTVETDQETSAVLAAFRAGQILGFSWLTERTAGRSLLDRLERGLDYVLSKRFDKDKGLVLGTHTADWGDVELGEADQQAIYAGSGSYWTCDIYDQSQFFGAARALAAILEATGDKAKATSWRARAESVRLATDRWLWQENRGFYRVHIHITPLKHDFDEDDMFPMGGNAEAVLSGLAGPEKAARIFAAAKARQKEYGVSTIGGTILPPYPGGTFKHPAVDEPYEYQNGGQWDWFSGRLIKAMFEMGEADSARAALLEIAVKNGLNGGLFEWDTKDGKGRGSGFYSGSAGVLADALIEGYYGIRLENGNDPGVGKLALSPRLGRDNGSVHVFFPSIDRFAGYVYEFDEKSGRITLSLNSDLAGSGIVRILSPWNTGTASSFPQLNKNPTPAPSLNAFKATIDGRPTELSIEPLQRDAYFIIKTGLNHRRIEIRKEK